MVATGTGIAPYRAYLRRMFMEDVPDYKFTGLAWLFMGVANSDAKLYDDEFQAILKKYPKQVRPGFRGVRFSGGASQGSEVAFKWTGVGV